MDSWICFEPVMGHWQLKKTVSGDRIGLASDDNKVIIRTFEITQVAFLWQIQSMKL
jgi:hypothetical protein